MKARFIASEGPWLEATLEVGSTILKVMDELTIDDRYSPEINQEIEVELSMLLDDDESWDDIFRGNPEKKKTIENIEGWSYRAFGEVISINPVVVDCGLIKVHDVVHANDERVIGEHVGFTITRLDATYA
ncbi:hypothetical protein DDZ13_08210 [Coraliomargarita sinensis]|uniref:Uncharacterized protein n=1 Tax=Coraliomargarita sinensis TaxID=2174842 RepID=A0A317ZJS1_9BACT|nr:hypothetical protein [Coraliomargarita sinensis]PXA04019.1 hypothetical protein DDZ13_08210 [Coraliomargarita sinensis]